MADHEIPTPRVDKIARDWAPQFEACEQLLAVIWDARPAAIPLTDLVMADGQRTNVGLVLLHLLGRALTSFQATLTLCRNGFPTHALMLCRSLFEDVIAAHWAAMPAHRDEVPARAERQEKLNDELEARARATFLQQEYASPLPPDEFAALMKEFRGGRYSWFGDFGDAKREVIESLRQNGSDVLLRWIEFVDGLVSRDANMALHSTVEGLVRSTRGSLSSGGIHYPSFGQVADVQEYEMILPLLTAPGCLAVIATVVLEDFGLDTSGVRAVGDKAADAAFELSPSKRRKLGRNDPCWCGSGRKLSACHEV
jgi:hypothetical protein